MKTWIINRWPLFSFAFLAILAAWPSSAQAQGWFNASWNYRVPVTVANPAGSALSNFQVHVTLSSSFDFANAKSDGSDVRFTASDGMTSIPFWIESWSSGTSASLWVQVPSIPSAGTTVYLYYGNLSASSASNGNATFDFFDDFAPPNQGPQTYFQLGPKQTVLTKTQSWETYSPHTLSVLQLNQGGHTYWGWYGLQDSCGGVGLAWSEDLVNWTKDTSNPLFSNGRWPSVIKVGSTLYMAYTFNYCGNSQINLASSTDGVNWTIIKTLVPQGYLGNTRNQNPNLWFNPNDGNYYLYWYNGNDSNVFNIMVRSATSPVGLDSTATEVKLLNSSVTLAAPNMLYYNGTYFLSTESHDVNGNWDVNVYSSTAPTSGFTLLPNNPVLQGGAACMFQLVFGTTLHNYICQINSSGVWEIDHLSSNLAIPRPAVPNPAKWTSSGGTWVEMQGTKPNGTTGFIAQGSTLGNPQILASTFTGTNYVLEAYGQQVQSNIWGLGFRVQNGSNLYSVNLYDNLNPNPNLYSYVWNSGASGLGTASVGALNPNTWYKLSVRASGSGFDIYKDNALQFHTSDGTYASGGVALYGEFQTVANFANVLVRKFAVTDPSASVGGEQIPPPTATLASVAVNPTTVTGGTSSTGTVTLTAPASTNGALVSLTSSNTAAATVPSSITVPSGATAATFTVTTSAVASQASVTITATALNSVNTSLTVNPPVLTAASLNPTTVIGGTSSTGTVTLNGPAPTGGIAVALNSSKTSVATVLASVTVPANSTTANFTVTTLAVSAQGSSTITGTLGVAQTATITVNPPAAASLSLNPASVLGGNNSIGTVTLTGPAPSGGIAVALNSSNTSAATVLSSVTVPANATSAQFTITTIASSSIVTSTITATLGVAQQATLTVNPVATGVASFTLNPTIVVGGSANTTSTATVTLNGVAPSAGIKVTITNGNTAAATAPTSVTVASGATSATFTVTALAVGAPSTSLITVTYTNSISATITVSPFTVSSVSLNPTAVVGGAANSTATLTLTGTAPSSGTKVTLTSSNTAAVTVPASVTVAAGATTATFTVTSKAVGSQATSTITATLNGTATAVFTVNPPAVSSVSLSPSSVTGGVANSIATLTLNGPAPTGGVSVSVSSSNTAAANVTGPVTVPAGATTATFTVTTSTVAAQTTSLITATLNGGSGSATLTVNALSAGGNVAFVRSAGNFGESAAYTATISPTAGDFLAVFVWQEEAATTPAVTDNLGTSYVLDCDLTYSQGFGARRLSVFHVLNAPTGITGVRITPNKPSRGIVAEYAGMPVNGTVLDVCGVANTQTSTKAWSSTATATTSTDLLFGLADTGFTGAAGYAPTGVWNARREQPDTTAADDSYLEDQIGVAPGSFTATGTTTATATESSVVVAFKTAVGPVAPTITSANSTSFAVGAAGSFTVTATGSPAPTYFETGTLPSNVTLNPTTGVLSGTPVAGTIGTYPITITASNGITPNATQNFTLTVGQAPAITSANNTTFTVGTAGSFTVTASGLPAPTFTESGALPSPVTLSAAGLLSGTPAAGTGGTYPITITASNGVAPAGTQSFTLTVNQAPAITSANSTTFVVGTAGSFTVAATGFPAPTVNETGTLPSGVTFASGKLSGTPAAGTAGTYPITFTASNGVGSNATQTFTLTVSATALSSAFVKAAGNKGESVPYSVTISPAASDFLAVVVWQTEGATTPTVTDNLGSAYVPDCDLTYNQGFGNRRVTVFHLLSAPAGITTVTVHPNKPSRGIVAEYSGMVSGAGLDVCGTPNTQASTTSWASTATITTSPDLILGLADTGFKSSPGYSASGAWADRLAQPDTIDADGSYLEDQINVAAGTYTATGATTASVGESSVVVAFKTGH